MANAEGKQASLPRQNQSLQCHVGVFIAISASVIPGFILVVAPPSVGSLLCQC